MIESSSPYNNLGLTFGEEGEAGSGIWLPLLGSFEGKELKAPIVHTPRPPPSCPCQELWASLQSRGL